MILFRLYYLDNYFYTAEYKSKRQARLALAKMLGVGIRYTKAVVVDN